MGDISRPLAIAVFGTTGTGKSSFLNDVAGQQLYGVGHSLTSHTSDPSAVTITLDGQPCVLIDTPGFNDTTRSDAEILRLIADMLELAYRQGYLLTSAIFLHRITDNRVSGSSLKMMQIFEALVGSASMPSVLLVTTMWDRIPQYDGQRREAELERGFWNHMVGAGARLARHYGGRDSALDIVRQVVRGPPVVLKLQRELVDDRTPLHNTVAGQALKFELDRYAETHRREMYRLQCEMLTRQGFELEQLRQEIDDERASLARRNQELSLLMQSRSQEITELKQRVEAQGGHGGKFWSVVGTILKVAAPLIPHVGLIHGAAALLPLTGLHHVASALLPF